MKKYLLLIFLLAVIGTASAESICVGKEASYNISFTSDAGGYYLVKLEAPIWVSVDKEYLTIAPGNVKEVLVTASPPEGITGDFNIKVIASSEETIRLSIKDCQDFSLTPASKTIEFCGNDQYKQPIIVKNNGPTGSKYFVELVSPPIWAVLDKDEISVQSGRMGEVDLYTWPAYDVEGSYPVKVAVRSERGDVVKESIVTAKVKKCYDASLFESKDSLITGAFTGWFESTNQTNAPAVSGQTSYLPYFLALLLLVIVVVAVLKTKLLSKFGKWLSEEEGVKTPHYVFKDKDDDYKPVKYDIEKPEPPKFKRKDFKTDAEAVEKLRGYVDSCLEEGFSKGDIKSLLLGKGWDKRLVKESLRRKGIFSKIAKWMAEDDFEEKVREEPIKKKEEKAKPERKITKIDRPKDKKSLFARFSEWLGEDEEIVEEKPEKTVAPKKLPKKLAKPEKPRAPPKKSLGDRFRAWLGEDEEAPVKEPEAKPKEKNNTAHKRKKELKNLKSEKKSMADRMREWMKEDE